MQLEAPGRVMFLIDGFNVYHALLQKPDYARYKWLNYRKLAECFITRSETIAQVIYFTAYATWSQEKVERHKIYVNALRLFGVETILGKFKVKDKKCRICGQTFSTYEEKLTDVNIAITLFKKAYLDEFDRAVIVSGDTDLIPAIKEVKSTFPTKRIDVVIPIGRQSEEMKAVSDNHYRMKEKHLQSSLLPLEIELSGGDKISCPTAWR